jgi:hypothetical protein
VTSDSSRNVETVLDVTDVAVTLAVSHQFSDTGLHTVTSHRHRFRKTNYVLTVDIAPSCNVNENDSCVLQYWLLCTASNVNQ